MVPGRGHRHLQPPLLLGLGVQAAALTAPEAGGRLTARLADTVQPGPGEGDEVVRLVDVILQGETRYQAGQTLTLAVTHPVL